MGAYVVRTSSLNVNHSCQLFRMSLRDKTPSTSTTTLIRAKMSYAVSTIFSSLAFLSSSVSMTNLSCAVATIFSSLAFLSSSIYMTNLSRSVAASFSSLALLSSSLSTANLSSSLSTTFSSLRFLSSSLSSHHFNLLRVARRYFLRFFVFLFLNLIFGCSFPLLQSLKLCLL